MTLSGAASQDQSGPVSNVNDGVLCIPKKFQYYWSLTIRLFSVISRTLVGGGLTEMQSVYFPAPADEVMHLYDS